MANFDVALGAEFVTGEVNSLHKECLIEIRNSFVTPRVNWTRSLLGKLKIALSFHINVNELLYRPKQLAKKKIGKRDLNENNFQWRDFIFIANFEKAKRKSNCNFNDVWIRIINTVFAEIKQNVFRFLRFNSTTQFLFSVINRDAFASRPPQKA